MKEDIVINKTLAPELEELKEESDFLHKKINKDDWRLTGQEAVLFKKKISYKKWEAKSAEWEHDHCVFCWNKFSDMADSLHGGYATEDETIWICSKCFEDFKDMFQWDVTE